jgi:hypothetical protein
MRTTSQYEPAHGMYVSFYTTPHEGMTILLDSHMTISAIQRHVREVIDWLSD